MGQYRDALNRQKALETGKPIPGDDHMTDREDSDDESEEEVESEEEELEIPVSTTPEKAQEMKEDHETRIADTKAHKALMARMSAAAGTSGRQGARERKEKRTAAFAKQGGGGHAANISKGLLQNPATSAKEQKAVDELKTKASGSIDSLKPHLGFENSKRGKLLGPANGDLVNSLPTWSGGCSGMVFCHRRRLGACG
jgi:hypothetical protein